MRTRIYDFPCAKRSIVLFISFFCLFALARVLNFLSLLIRVNGRAEADLLVKFYVNSIGIDNYSCCHGNHHSHKKEMPSLCVRMLFVVVVVAFCRSVIVSTKM